MGKNGLSHFEQLALHHVNKELKFIQSPENMFKRVEICTRATGGSVDDIGVGAYWCTGV